MAVPQRSGTETGRFESRSTYGKQIKDRRRQTAAEVFNPTGTAVHAVRPAQGCVPEVRYLPHLFPETRRPGLHSRGSKGQLVATVRLFPKLFCCRHERTSTTIDQRKID